MKITIPKNVSVKEATDILQSFLCEKYEGYPYLKEDLNIYVVLTGGNEDCPDNNFDFKWTDGRFVNVFEEREKSARERIFELWDSYRRKVNENHINAEIKANKALSLLARAEEKGCKPQTLEKRKQECIQIQREREKAREACELTEKLNKILEQKTEETVDIRCYKETRGSAYVYVVTAVITFFNVDGSNRYFDGKTVSTTFPTYVKGY